MARGKAGQFDEISVGGDEDLVEPGGDADTDPGAGLDGFEGIEVGLQSLEQGQSIRGDPGPGVIAREPGLDAGGPYTGGDVSATTGPDRVEGVLEGRRGNECHFRARAGDDGGTLGRPSDDGDGGVGIDLRLEGVRPVHLHDGLDGVAPGDEAPQVTPVLVQHPPVGADEGVDAVRGELAEGGLEEGDVEVGAATHRGVCGAIGGRLGRRDILKADVRGVADDELGGWESPGVREVVARSNPFLDEMVRVRRRDAFGQ